MIQRPEATEFAPHFLKYVNLVEDTDPQAVLARQLEEITAFGNAISEEKSLHRYAPGKWSIRQVLSHSTDTERALAYRMLWFARGFEAPLHSFDQETAAAGAEADTVSWRAHVEEFRAVRLATMALVANMPAAGWTRGGVVSGNPVSVRALAYIIPGHVAHHVQIIRERYV